MSRVYLISAIVETVFCNILLILSVISAVNFGLGIVPIMIAVWAGAIGMQAVDDYEYFSNFRKLEKEEEKLNKEKSLW